MTNSTRRFLALALAAIIIIGMCTTLASFIYYVIPSKTVSSQYVGIEGETGINKLEINIDKDELIIKNDSKFAIEAPKYVSEDTLGDKLVIKEKDHWFKRRGVITLYIPYNKTFEDITINAGVGKITIDSLSGKNLYMDAGVGDIRIDKLDILEKAKIHGGIGNIEIKNSNVGILDLDAGIGNVNIATDVRISGYIDLGIGNIDIDLLGSEDSYKFDASKGIGEIKIFGKSFEGISGNGEALIKIDGGIGSINVY